MKRLTARTVMTSDVITTTVSTPVKDVVQVMDERHISALPVLSDDGDLLGVVSEADLLVKQGHADDREPPGWFATPRRRREAAKVGAEVAGDLMTSPAVTIDPQARLTRIARTMAEKKVKRLPVVDKDGELIGIVSRSDVIRAFLRPDADIRREIDENMFEYGLLGPPHSVTIDVADGVVELQGFLELRSSVELVVEMVGSIDGVVDVVNGLTYRRDDTVRHTSPMPQGVEFPRTF